MAPYTLTQKEVEALYRAYHSAPTSQALDFSEPPTGTRRWVDGQRDATRTTPQTNQEFILPYDADTCLGASPLFGEETFLPHSVEQGLEDDGTTYVDRLGVTKKVLKSSPPLPDKHYEPMTHSQGQKQMERLGMLPPKKPKREAEKDTPGANDNKSLENQSLSRGVRLRQLLHDTFMNRKGMQEPAQMETSREGYDGLNPKQRYAPPLEHTWRSTYKEQTDLNKHSAPIVQGASLSVAAPSLNRTEDKAVTRSSNPGIELLLRPLLPLPSLKDAELNIHNHVLKRRAAPNNQSSLMVPTLQSEEERDRAVKEELPRQDPSRPSNLDHSNPVRGERTVSGEERENTIQPSVSNPSFQAAKVEAEQTVGDADALFVKEGFETASTTVFGPKVHPEQEVGEDALLSHPPSSTQHQPSLSGPKSRPSITVTREGMEQSKKASPSGVGEEFGPTQRPDFDGGLAEGEEGRREMENVGEGERGSGLPFQTSLPQRGEVEVGGTDATQVERTSLEGSEVVFAPSAAREEGRDRQGGSRSDYASSLPPPLPSHSTVTASTLHPSEREEATAVRGKEEREVIQFGSSSVDMPSSARQEEGRESKALSGSFFSTWMPSGGGAPDPFKSPFSDPSRFQMLGGRERRDIVGRGDGGVGRDPLRSGVTQKRMVPSVERE